MNFLAHAYLSFNEPGILTGNMISDYVKGKKKFDYIDDIRHGIELHRYIDEFTDTHPATLEMKTIFKPAYRLYAGAFADVAYDHFLATDTNEFNDPAALKAFSSGVYVALNNNIDILPDRFKTMLPYMAQQDWLYNYRFNSGMQKSFEGVVRRSKYLTDASQAFELFEKHYDFIGNCYKEFFTSVKQFAAHQLMQLRNT